LKVRTKRTGGILDERHEEEKALTQSSRRSTEKKAFFRGPSKLRLN
jgi:hypothetical protein